MAGTGRNLINSRNQLLRRIAELNVYPEGRVADPG
jgi:hypothetical protein